VVYEGTHLSIICKSAKPPKWTKNGGALPASLMVIAEATLIIMNAELQDSGRYSCHGSIDKLGKKKFVANSKLTVAGVVG